MWSKPWSYKEGLVIGAGLLVIELCCKCQWELSIGVCLLVRLM